MIGQVRQFISHNELAVMVTGLMFLLVTSGVVVRIVMDYINHDRGQLMGYQIRTGKVIGKMENILVYIFVLGGAYTALALVFVAKGVVTRDEGDDNKYSQYILAGSLTNFTYSLLISEVVKLLIN